MMADLSEKVWFILLISSLLGYLFGSLSFARIVTLLKTKSKTIDPISQPIPGSDQIFESDSISATVISQNLGRRYGCLTSLLDMLKVALPTFLIKLIFPENPYFLLTGAAGVAGHVYPIYHRFRGGRGESPMIGAMVIINWYGILITNTCSTILAFLTGSVLVWRYGWYILMIFWYWVLFKNIYYVGFMIIANFLFWFSMSKDLRKFASMKQDKGMDIKEEDVSDFLLMGKRIGRVLDYYSLPAFIKKMRK